MRHSRENSNFILRPFPESGFDVAEGAFRHPAAGGPAGDAADEEEGDEEDPRCGFGGEGGEEEGEAVRARR